MLIRSKENRKNFRVEIRQLASVVLKRGSYTVINESNETIDATITIKDISSGGLCIKSKVPLEEGASVDLNLPKIGELDTQTIPCEVKRAIYKDDMLIASNGYYELGLKFKSPNTEYVKQFIEFAAMTTL